MTYDLGVLFGTSVGYLGILFLIAYFADRKVIPTTWIDHPVTYSLSLGVYASSWTYYGSVGFADSNGYLFLTIYLGVTLAFILSPVLLKPLLKLTREHQLASLADLFSFRYRSQLAGIMVTLFMLVGSLPYIALQIRAVTESLQILTQQTTPDILALGFCLTLMLFAILFGARHASPREKHRGLVAAVAFESLVKLIALLLIGIYAIYFIFDGPDHLTDWLKINPDAVTALFESTQHQSWFTLILLSFSAAFLLPRQFHMLFTENLNEKSLDTATWLFPLFLLALNLFIPVILWAGNFIQLESNPDTYVLGITVNSDLSWLPLLAFLGGISAASAMVIISSIALANMCLNHLILPVKFPRSDQNLHTWIIWGKRTLIVLVILAGYAFYSLFQQRQGLAQQGLLSFVAVAQFLPGIAGVLYWKQATRPGFIAGLFAGMSVWLVTLLIPLLYSSGIIETDFAISRIISDSGMDKWTFATLVSLSLNTGLFILVSIYSRQSQGEMEAARSCCAESLLPLAGIVSAKSAFEFESILSNILGESSAKHEVQQALNDLKMSPYEKSPSELRRLRERIEKNLSGLIGPQLSHAIINSHLQLDPNAKTALADSIKYVEQRLENSQILLDGLSSELKNLHRYHRNILLDLPLGVCVISHNQQINIWNMAMEAMSEVKSSHAVGKKIDQLPDPWRQVLIIFLKSADTHQYHLEVKTGDETRWFNLHKATILEPNFLTGHIQENLPGTVILFEDLTDLENLESELAHSDRLASIGRLAAGVAHEIGNPVTGIASLAQNLEEETDPGEIAASSKSILEQTNRINTIIRSLMNFSRNSEDQSYDVKTPLCEIIDDALNLVRLSHKNKQIQFKVECNKDFSIKGDRQRLSQVFVNLLTNAIDASDLGGTITIKGKKDGNEIRIMICDEGSGIPEDIKDKLFEPFVTSKPTGQGTGLGLALAYKTVRDHNGDIEIKSETSAGTSVIVRLPSTNQ
ncbi:MAG: ATP-binding protein [Gammaproteobacteria bacterium]